MNVNYNSSVITLSCLMNVITTVAEDTVHVFEIPYVWLICVPFTAPCPVSKYGKHCNLTCLCVTDQYESCDDNGTCLCSPGWTGNNCSQGWYKNVVASAF